MVIRCTDIDLFLIIFPYSKRLPNPAKEIMLPLVIYEIHAIMSKAINPHQMQYTFRENYFCVQGQRSWFFGMVR